MFLLQFLGTMAFVAVVLLSLIAALDIFVPRLIPVPVERRSSGSSRARKLAKVDARVR
ncbi:hypothetical protein AWB76_05780 [Caballeronia temeraria]|uniref:Uncharacterized protein n=1 Tax=Caballeronia temeraria TaxID=1777137 RepID=A0A158CNM5_9BURK|nr:hypothetical protein [Caballeronia temeraria]SAK83922.1 hypothetical protein AWB76_05780 [Caballeronia temeraria]